MRNYVSALVQQLYLNIYFDYRICSIVVICVTILSNNKLLFTFFLHSNRYCIVFLQLEYGDTSIFEFLHSYNYSNSIESKDFFPVKYYNRYSVSDISYISVCHILSFSNLASPYYATM